MIRIQRLWTLRHSFVEGASAFSSLTQGRSGAFACAISTSTRGVQFEQTSATLRGINKKNRAVAAPWITKSTKDYISEADSRTTSIDNPLKDKLQRDAQHRRERFVRVTEDTDRVFDAEMDRMRDYNVRRWRKGIDFFKRQGIGFTVLYVSAYLGSLILLYVGFATGILKKETAYEFMFFFIGGYVDKEWFYKRVEAWGSYVDMGFAFVINEMLEFIRFPLMMYTFYVFRPYITGVNRRVKASIFRFGAAES